MLPAGKRSCYECSECHKFFRRQINLSLQLRVCKAQELICDVCNTTFGQYSIMQEHKEKYHSELKTSHKNGSAKDNVLVENEQMNLFNDVTRDLSISDSIAATATVTTEFRSLSSTGRTSKQAERIGCKKCGKVVQNLWTSRRYHAQTHITDMKRFNCSECGYGSVLKLNVEKHIAKRHKHTTNAVAKDRGPELQPRLLNMLTECFDLKIRGIQRTKKEQRKNYKDPKQKKNLSATVSQLECNKFAYPYRTSIGRMSRYHRSTNNSLNPGSEDSKHEDTNAEIVGSVAAHSQSNVSSPLIEECGLPGSAKWQNVVQRVEGVRHTIDDLTKRFNSLKKLLQDT